MKRRRRRQVPQSSGVPVELPKRVETGTSTVSPGKSDPSDTNVSDSNNHGLPAPLLSGSPTPTTSQAPSEADSTQPTTPSSVLTPHVQPQIPSSKGSAQQPRKGSTVVPVVPTIASLLRPAKNKLASHVAEHAEPVLVDAGSPVASLKIHPVAKEVADPVPISDEVLNASPLQVKAAPKSWADLVRTKTLSTTMAFRQGCNIPASQSSGISGLHTGSICSVLSSFSVNGAVGTKIPFLKPRGLVNTGNMCYMNSASSSLVLWLTYLRLINSKVLQILLHCIPFYEFLNRVGKHVAYRFKSDTPLIDAM